MLEAEVLDFWYQEHYGAIADITDIKCGFLSKDLLQRTQQRGGCTKHLRNDKFVSKKMSSIYYME